MSSPVAAPSPPEKPTPVEQAIDLAAKQHCKEALPLLNEHTAGITDKQLKYRALMATERCAMRLGDGRGTVNALMALRHEFPKDPDVLYLTTKVFLDIAVHASRELADIAPDSYQVRELQAENLESQNKWEEAAAIYRKILEENPEVPAIHFRLGRAVLSEPETPATVEEARKEFEQEVTIDPTNGSAEFWLGEIARRQARWDVAVPHFTAAIKLDPNLSEAMLALGMTFDSEEHFADAIGPLEQYTRTVPDDPAGHYQLAVAYLRLGRKEDSAREKGLVEHLSEKQSGLNPAPTTATPH
jgi:tetratricopeptide (TPR) repeat protein